MVADVGRTMCQDKLRKKDLAIKAITQIIQQKVRQSARSSSSSRTRRDEGGGKCPKRRADSAQPHTDPSSIPLPCPSLSRRWSLRARRRTR